MEQEIFKLKSKRKVIIERIARAKELGDLKENADYHDARDEQGFNEAHIQELEAVLRTATIVEKKSSGDIVELGSTVTLESDGVKKVYTITGSNEASPEENKLSIESPLVSAMLNKKKGDDFEFEAPSGIKKFTIMSIK